MILVDVYIPAVDQTYDFRLEESCCPDVITGEICEMAEQKEQMIPGKKEQLLLFDASTGRMLLRDRTLTENGVADGHLLIMV
ncbi:MAG: hypothetical protein KH452_01560 [Clostridiales bacterium]|nr:hypothetical protein [Clostridiales bacterium]